MSKTIVLCAVALTLCPFARAQAAQSAVSVDEVLAMMDTVPAAPGNPRSVAYRWSSKSAARPIARAIMATAPNREWAARMAVYAIHESALSTECAAGDGGKSYGAWQLQGVSTEIACDPARAAPVWLAMAQRSIADCSALPAYERMAELTSGSCARGREVARRREVLVLGALAALEP